MKHSTRILVSGAALAALAAGVASALHPRATAFELTGLSLHIEVDLPGDAGATLHADGAPPALLDLPAEIVLEAESDRPLRVLRVVSPTGATLFGWGFTRGGGLAGTEISIESESASLRELLDRYPPGTYHLVGATLDGQPVAAAVDLAPRFPGSFSAGFASSSDAVPVEAAELRWTAAPRARSYMLEIESETLEFELSVRLPKSATSFLIPAGLLESGQPYEYSLSVKGDTDNELELEGSFTTAP